MKKEGKIRVAVFGAAAVALLAGFWLDARLSLSASQRELEYVYQRALGDLTDEVAGMRLTLEKAQYVGTASSSTAVAAELLEKSAGAKSAMASLPFSQESAEGISRFLSQVGDYALAMNRKLLAGSPLEAADRDGLKSLAQYAGKLADSLGNIRARLKAENGKILAAKSALNNIEEITQLSNLDDDIDQAAQEFADFPALLYDGPISDHITRRKPLALQSEQPINEEEAREEAARFLQADAELLNYLGEGGSQLPVYSFATEDSMVNITKQGGRVAYYKKSGEIAEEHLGYREALSAAKDFLAELGYSNMKESYYLCNDRLCTINFHGVEQDEGGREVFCYPDLIKVVIELEEGGAVEADCTGWLMNHQQRKLSAPRLTEEEAKASLSPQLEVQSAGLAIIPSPGLEEVLCWEFHCTAADGTELLSYVNGATGQEEQLYILQKDSHGILTV